LPHDPQFNESVAGSTHAVVAPDAHCIWPDGHETSGAAVSATGVSSTVESTIVVSTAGTSLVLPSGVPPPEHAAVPTAARA
jgi:hypothetical protein